MDIRQLRYFKEIVDQGSISKAAEILHIAQPPLSMLLKQLEQQYDMPLIKRYREKWEVTEAGQLLYAHAEEVLQHIEMIDVKMMYLKQGEEGQVRVGVASSCLHLIDEVIQEFSQRYPRALLHVTKGNSAQIERLLFANELDVAIILEPNTAHHYEVLALQESPFALAVPAKWYEALDVNTFSIKQIASYPFVFLQAMEGYSMLEEIQQYLRNEKLALNIVVECKDIPLVRQLVSKEIGISILPVVEENQSPHIRYIELPQLTTKIQPVLIYKKEMTLSPICSRFVALFN